MHLIIVAEEATCSTATHLQLLSWNARKESRRTERGHGVLCRLRSIRYSSQCLVRGDPPCKHPKFKSVVICVRYDYIARNCISWHIVVYVTLENVCQNYNLWLCLYSNCMYGFNYSTFICLFRNESSQENKWLQYHIDCTDFWCYVKSCMNVFVTHTSLTPHSCRSPVSVTPATVVVGHPSCLNWSGMLPGRAKRLLRWQCLECKTCTLCLSGREVRSPVGWQAFITNLSILFVNQSKLLVVMINNVIDSPSKMLISRLF